MATPSLQTAATISGEAATKGSGRIPSRNAPRRVRSSLLRLRLLLFDVEDAEAVASVGSRSKTGSSTDRTIIKDSIGEKNDDGALSLRVQVLVAVLVFLGRLRNRRDGMIGSCIPDISFLIFIV